MDRIISLLEENRLTSPDRATDFALRRDFSEVRSLRDSIYESLRAEAEKARGHQVAESLDAYNFLASSSLRGDTGCVRWDCRLRKVRILGRYGALYCDRIVVPLRLERHTEVPNEYHDRYTFAGALLALLELRPLIEAEVAVLYL